MFSLQRTGLRDKKTIGSLPCLRLNEPLSLSLERLKPAETDAP